MGADQNIDWRRAAASTLEWWRDAGVDVSVGEEPFDWLAPAEAPAAAAAAARTGVRSAPVAAAEPATLPATLDDFLAWRSGDAAPEAGWPAQRFAFTGDPAADLLILIDCPERDDRDALLGGDAGRLFDAMLAAIGRSRENICLAAVCTARPIGGRMPRDVEQRLGEIARHHLALAAPRRALALGDAASRALTAANVAEARGRLHPLNHKDGRMTEVVASFHPRLLLTRPALKAEAWRDLQMLIGGMS